MLKNLLKFTLALAPAVAFGQSKYDMRAASAVENYRQAAILNSTEAKSLGAEKMTFMVSVSDESVLDQLRALNADIDGFSNDVAIVTIPVRDIERMAELRGVVSIDGGRQQQAMMYFARESGNANAVLNGTGAGLEQAYTGKGVVTGLMDQGIDPNHVAFFNDNQTENRVKAVYTYMSTTQTGSPNGSYTTPDAIASFKTDYSAWTHGTHVASIMAGGYNGTSNYALQRRIYNSQPMPFYGLAYNSDIVMCGGYLYDNNIANGVTKVIEYAKSVNKPAVVNLSLGSVVGPHDGTSSLSRYLAGEGENGIIVIASGNDGDQNCCLNANFNRLSSQVISGISITEPTEQAWAEFWYNTSDTFKFEFLLYNPSSGKVTSYELTESGRTVTINTSDETFASAYAAGSSVQMYGNVDPTNNRYYVSLRMNLQRGASSNAAIVPAIRINGASGKKMNGTMSNGTFVANGISGSVNGTPSGSVSDMATGANVIVAGAYTSSSSFTYMNGSQLSYIGATDNGQICSFSSYGTTYDGKKLPDLCAPGSAIVAAVSSYAYPAPQTSQYSADATFNGKKNYWAPMQGTSMACPYISGTVALMLEADPTLDVDKARTILMETAVLPTGLTSDDKAKWGAGRIDVLAAVKKTLDDKAGIGNILADDPHNFIVTPVDGGYNVYVAGEQSLTVTLYDMTGRTAATATAGANTLDLATSSLSKGIYLLVAQGKTQTHSTKIAVK